MSGGTNSEEKRGALGVGVPIQKKNEAPLGPEARGKEVPPSHPTLARELSQQHLW